MTMHRRQFLTLSATVVASPLLAIDPIARPAKPQLKLGLAAYSYRKYLDLKKPTMTLFDFIDAAAEMPLDGVELTSYYFAETTDDYLDKLKAHAAARKLAISGVPVGNSFTMRDDAKRAAEIEKVKQWCARAGRLGTQTVRIFAGNMEKGDDLAECRRRVVAAIEACAPAAKQAGVWLALENHGGITADAEGLLAIVKAVDCEHFGVNIDTGNFKTADPYAEVAKIAPYGIVCQVKTEISPTGNVKVDADLPRMIQILKDANFDGYVVLEYEAAEEPKKAVPRYVKQLRELIG